MIQDDTKEESFLGRVLGFENIILAKLDAPQPFASMTVTFRNPVFLSFQCRKLRNTDRNDPSLMPLIVAIQKDRPWLFYHYRKQRLLRNTDENLLFFPSVDIDIRKESFRGFDALIQTFVEPWDSRVDQRSRIIVDKVITSLIQDIPKTVGNSLKILDIGSGDGCFTSRIIKRMKKTGLIGKRKVDISLLDILSREPEMTVGVQDLRTSFSKVEYISQDYMKWFDEIDCVQYCDIIFLFRILHNMSLFRIISEREVRTNSSIYRGRYRVYPHLSEYYHAISLLFKEMLRCCDEEKTNSQMYYPSRIFRDSCLMLNDGTSIIDKMCSISNGILIEDADLKPEILLGHLSKYSQDNIYVYDFSTRLHLTVNHIYWITRNKQSGEIPGEKIWPKSGKL